MQAGSVDVAQPQPDLGLGAARRHRTVGDGPAPPAAERQRGRRAGDLQLHRAGRVVAGRRGLLGAERVGPAGLLVNVRRPARARRAGDAGEPEVGGVLVAEDEPAVGRVVPGRHARHGVHGERVVRLAGVGVNDRRGRRHPRPIRLDRDRAGQRGVLRPAAAHVHRV